MGVEAQAQVGALGGVVAVAVAAAAAAAAAAAVRVVLRVAHRDTNVRRALRPEYGYLSTVSVQANSNLCCARCWTSRHIGNRGRNC